jgi:hypothetical protein
MFRIKDPKVSIPWYEKVLGMKVGTHHTMLWRITTDPKIAHQRESRWRLCQLLPGKLMMRIVSYLADVLRHFPADLEVSRKTNGKLIKLVVKVSSSSAGTTVPVSYTASLQTTQV